MSKIVRIKWAAILLKLSNEFIFKIAWLSENVVSFSLEWSGTRNACYDPGAQDRWAAEPCRPESATTGPQSNQCFSKIWVWLSCVNHVPWPNLSHWKFMFKQVRNRCIQLAHKPGAGVAVKLLVKLHSLFLSFKGLHINKRIVIVKQSLLKLLEDSSQISGLKSVLCWPTCWDHMIRPMLFILCILPLLDTFTCGIH